MNILHYTIGLPPTRHGGSVQYANDLMNEQIRQGNNVFALICGDTLFRPNISSIKYKKTIGRLKVFSLVNPITPTLIYATSNPEEQHRCIKINLKNIEEFVRSNNIEIFHIHTVMGLHRDIVTFIKSLGVKIIYTTHDFHGICLRNSLLTKSGHICNNPNDMNCAQCCISAPSDLFLRLCNSNIYHLLKKLPLPKKKVLSIANNSSAEQNTPYISESNSKEFQNLIDYYVSYFNEIDLFHFNSSQTQAIFTKFIPFANGSVIPVITASVHDNRIKLLPKKQITFGFIGSLNEYKGFPMLRNVLIDLKNRGLNNFKLKVYGGGLTGYDPDCNNIQYCGSYKYSDLSKTLYELDCVLVPSKSYETFSLVTLEALAHGIPAIVSNNVGAKDLINQIDGNFVFSTEEDLKHKIQAILTQPQVLAEFNSKLLSLKWSYNIENHTSEILNFYNNYDRKKPI